MAATIRLSILTLAVMFQGRMSGAQVGITLNVMLVANSTLLKLVESWTALEASLGAIARLKTLEETISREDTQSWTLEPREDWPTRGCVQIRSITASYGYRRSNPNLKDIR